MIRKAIILSKVLMTLTLIAIIGASAFWAYWTLSPETFANWTLCDKSESNGTFFNMYICFDGLEGEARSINELSSFYKFWMFFHLILTLSIYYLIIREVKAVLNSMKSLNTFYEGNIRHFKVLARLAFIGWMVSIFSFYESTNGHPTLSLDFSIGMLILAMAFSLLSQVFQEGKILLDDKTMIV